jgi:hypothetical protein
VIEIGAHEPLNLLRVGLEIGQPLLDGGADQRELREVAVMGRAFLHVLPKMFMTSILMHLLLSTTDK